MSNDIHEIVQFVVKRLGDGKSLRGAISELRDKEYSEDEIRDVLLAYTEYMAKKGKGVSKIVDEQDKVVLDDAAEPADEPETKSDNSSDAIKKALKKALKDERHRIGEEDPDKELYVNVKGGKIDKAFDELGTGRDEEYTSYNTHNNTETYLPAGRKHHSNNMLWVIIFMIPLLLFAVIYVLTHVLEII